MALFGQESNFVSIGVCFYFEIDLILDATNRDSFRQ